MTHQRKEQAWKTVPLGTLAEFRNGVNFTKESFGRGIKVINVKDFQGRFKPSYEELAEINPEGVVRENDLLKEDDILFVRSNGNRQLIGRSLLIKGAKEPVTHSAFTIRARFRSVDVFPLFYAYALRSYIVRDALSAFGSGTNINNLNQSILSNLLVPLPPRAAQRKIADILFTYDNLIENNTRRIKILEEMARTLYREWFVHFRFPGWEHFELIASPIGKIPRGWYVKKLSELVSTQYGYTESATNEVVGPKYVRGMDINKTSYIEWGSVPYCKINNEDKKNFDLSIGDVMVIRMADPGKVGIVEKEVSAVFASYLVRLKIRSPKLSPYFLFYFLTSDQYQGYITGASTGTTRRSASAVVIADTEMIIPHNDIRQRFEKEVATLRYMLNSLLDRNAVLCRTRDLLLPKLISGEVDVEALQISER